MENFHWKSAIKTLNGDNCWTGLQNYNKSLDSMGFYWWFQIFQEFSRKGQYMKQQRIRLITKKIKNKMIF